MDFLDTTFLNTSGLCKFCIQRTDSTVNAGHTLPIYVSDDFREERPNSCEENVVIQNFVVCDETSLYEKPLIPNCGRHSSVCRNEIGGAQKEKTRYPQFSQHSTRLATFVYGQFITDHQTLANLGFFYKGQWDRLCCYECGVTLSVWRKDDDPFLEHIRYSPECRYLASIIDRTTLQDYKAQLQQITTNEARQGATGGRLEITSSQEDRNQVRSPEYASYNVRLSTFARFQAIDGLDVHGIAAAGFYYTGDKDIVRCYSCDGGLKQWVRGDDPWNEHYRWFPNCSYLKQSNYNSPRRKIKQEPSSRSFEEKPLAAPGEEHLPEVVARELNELTIEQQKPKNLEAEPDLNRPAALAVLEFGYSRNAVKMAIKELGRKGQTTLTADRILQVLISFEDKGIMLPSDDSKENKKTKDILSESTKVSSSNLSLEEQLTWKEIKETLTSRTVDKDRLLSYKSSGDFCRLLEENETLILKMICKRCRQRQRNILVLPCTHFCLCEQCSKEVSLCPECWKPIKERVKTLVS